MPPKKKPTAKKPKAKPAKSKTIKSAIKNVQSQTNRQHVNVKVNVEAPKPKRRSATKKQPRQPLQSGFTPVSSLVEHYRPTQPPVRFKEESQKLLSESDYKLINLLNNKSIDDVYNDKNRGGTQTNLKLYDDLFHRRAPPNSQTLDEMNKSRMGSVFDASLDNMDTRSNKSNKSRHSNDSGASMRTGFDINELGDYLKANPPPLPQPKPPLHPLHQLGLHLQRLLKGM